MLTTTTKEATATKILKIYLSTFYFILYFFASPGYPTNLWNYRCRAQKYGGVTVFEFCNPTLNSIDQNWLSTVWGERWWIIEKHVCDVQDRQKNQLIWWVKSSKLKKDLDHCLCLHCALNHASYFEGSDWVGLRHSGLDDATMRSETCPYHQWARILTSQCIPTKQQFLSPKALGLSRHSVLPLPVK